VMGTLGWWASTALIYNYSGIGSAAPTSPVAPPCSLNSTQAELGNMRTLTPVIATPAQRAESARRD